jgi:putative long chain acyl-CoA synthase
MGLLSELVTGPIGRLGAAAQNALEVARFGGLETGETPTPYEIAAAGRVHRLRRYLAPTGDNGNGARPAVLLVPPMMLTADVYDVAPTSSAVGVLHDHGADPWVVDFGAPEHQDGGLERTLGDHVLAVSEAVDQVRAITGRDVHLGGYSQGGMFCYQAAAYRRGDGLASVVTCGAPVDTHGALPFGIPEEIGVRGAGFLADHVLRRTALPAWVSRNGFRLLDPVKTLRQQADFLLALHDRDALLPRERQRQFVEAHGWVAWPGPALAEFVSQFFAHNRMLSGGFVISERVVTLADVSLPVLTVVGEVDEIAPPRAVRAVGRAAPRADVYELTLPAGHLGLVVGEIASRRTWPVVAGWARWVDGLGDGDAPVQVRHVSADESDHPLPVSRRVGVGLDLVAGVGLDVARSTLRTAARAAATTREAARQLPRLSRLERMQPGTRISLGLLLDEQAAAAPGAVALLFGDRAHTRAAVKRRIDDVVRGLLSLGVCEGEHVGVLMRTRPSALTLVAALNRLGAVAVLLRPDGAIARELELGRCARVVADPELAARARAAGAAAVLVLGGGGRPRELGGDLADMERIDPAAVRVPSSYRPNRGRAGDLAFVLFSGEGEHTRSRRISNGRWALSAFGTASAAALSSADTVYAATPISHASGLLTSVGGAVAGGARLALAQDFEPDRFWDDVRRYGATVAAYSWTMLRELVERPPDRAERHHPLRLFVGTGMPRGLWRRVEERFAPARVLESYASADGEAVLVNVAGDKPGCKGRPLPGSPEVRIATYDANEARLYVAGNGFAVPAPRGTTGMLLARERRGFAAGLDIPLRGVFRRGDAWLATGDLFRADAGGDLWLVGDAGSLVRTARGPVAMEPIAEALGDLDGVELAVAYGVRHGRAAHELVVAAVTLRPRATLTAAAIERALAQLAAAGRPDVVCTLPEIPLTAWHRPRVAPLRDRGLPRTGAGAWVRAGGRYVRLTSERRRKLVASAC